MAPLTACCMQNADRPPIRRTRSGPTSLQTSIERARRSSAHVELTRTKSGTLVAGRNISAVPEVRLLSESTLAQIPTQTPRQTPNVDSHAPPGPRSRRPIDIDPTVSRLDLSNVRCYRQPRSSEWIGNASLSPNSSSPREPDETGDVIESFPTSTVGGMNPMSPSRRREEINEQLAARRLNMTDRYFAPEKNPTLQPYHAETYIPRTATSDSTGPRHMQTQHQREQNHAYAYRPSRRHPAFDSRPAVRDTMPQAQSRRVGSFGTVNSEPSILEEGEDATDEALYSQHSGSTVSPISPSSSRRSQRKRPEDLRVDRTSLNPNAFAFHHPYNTQRSLSSVNSLEVPRLPPRSIHRRTPPPLLPQIENESQDLADAAPPSDPTATRSPNPLHTWLTKQTKNTGPNLEAKDFILKLQHDIAPSHWLLRPLQLLSWLGFLGWFISVPITSRRKLAFNCFELQTQILRSMGIYLNTTLIDRHELPTPSDIFIPASSTLR